MVHNSHLIRTDAGRIPNSAMRNEYRGVTESAQQMAHYGSNMLRTEITQEARIPEAVIEQHI